MWNAPLDGASLDFDLNNAFGLPEMAMMNENDCAWPTLEQANWGMFDIDTMLAQGFPPSATLFDELASMAPSSSPVESFDHKTKAMDRIFGDLGDGLGAGAQLPVFLDQHQEEQGHDQLLPNSLGLYGEPSFLPEHSANAVAVAPEAIFSAEDFQQYMALAHARACSTPPPPPPYGLAPSPYASTPALSPDSGLASDSDSEAVTPCPVRVASSSSSSLSPPLAAPAFFSPGPGPASASAPRPAFALPRSAPCTPARKPRSRNAQSPRKKCASARKARKSAGSAFNFLRNNAAAGPSKTKAEDEDEEDDDDEEYTPGLKCYVCGYKQARIAGDRRSFRRHMETHDEFKKYVWRCIGLLRAFSFPLFSFFSVIKSMAADADPCSTEPDGTYAGGCGKAFSRKDALQRHLRSGSTDRYCMSVTDRPFLANMD